MTQQEFIAKHGPLTPNEATTDFFRRRCVQLVLKNGEWLTSRADAPPIFDGQFTNWGYFAAGQQPQSLDLDWAALDQALTQAHHWAELLAEGSCYGAIGSEGDAPFVAFVQAHPRTGPTWDAEAVLGPLPEPLALALEHGTFVSGYESEVQFLNVDDQECLFMTDEEFEDRMLDAEEGEAAWDDEQEEADEQTGDEDEQTNPGPLPADLAAFRQVSHEMRRGLRRIAEGLLYPSFVEFPVLYVGEDAHNQLVGVATTCVWT